MVPLTLMLPVPVAVKTTGPEGSGELSAPLMRCLELSVPRFSIKPSLVVRVMTPPEVSIEFTVILFPLADANPKYWELPTELENKTLPEVPELTTRLPSNDAPAANPPSTN